MKLKLLLTPRYEIPQEKELKGRNVILFPPLGVATLTGFLRENNLKVDQDDLNVKVFYHNLSEKYPEKRINLELFNDEKRIEKFAETKNDLELEREGEKILKLTNCKNYDIIGFSIYETNLPSVGGIALVLAKLLKRKYEPTIICGGHPHQGVIEKLVSSRLINYGFYDDAQIKLLSFIERFENGKKIEEIEDMVYLNKHGKVIRNHGLGKEKILVKPDFEGLPIDLYRTKIFWEDRGIVYNILLLPYRFTIGCPNQCAFCTCSTGWWIKRDPERVADELMEFSKKYKTKHFLFLNNEININPKYTDKVADEIIKKDLDIVWSDCATFKGMDKNLLEKLKRAGVARLVFGLESASPFLLNFINKRVPPIQQVEKILETSHKLGIWNGIDIITGFPYEKSQDVVITLNFIKRNRNHIHEIFVSKFRLEGRMLQYPDEYGVIKLNMKNLVFREEGKMPFKEIYGLSWKEKQKQIDEYWRKLNEIRIAIFTADNIPPRMKEEELILLHYLVWITREKIWDRSRRMFITATPLGCKI